ncbi:MAG: bifunctional phosphoglucose/phosphomannose isomerase [Thermoprotei archaeon]|nr:MAG: bifunctional phosphoglucose/phosphomannose isomerase [Thermoprotei archaeon]
MEDYYLGWLEQVEKALSIWGCCRVDIEPRLIVITGMGGSGCIGDYVYALASTRKYFKCPIFIVKSHKLPSFINEKDLVFIISYSGNTLETRHTYLEALRRKCSLVVITSNGFLERDAKQKNIPLITVTRGIAPRTALPEMLLAVLNILDTSGLTIVSRDEVEDLRRFLKENMAKAYNEAMEIAQFIYSNKGTLIIATHTPLEALAIRGKNEFNENSKIPVKIDVAPECAHNDIVGWENPFTDKWTVLEIVDPRDSIGLKIIDFMDKIYREKRYPIKKILLKGEYFLQKLLYGSLLLGLASVKLARLRGINPLETKNISKYKSRVHDILGQP